MFITPHFGGCKYTNNFLFINNFIKNRWLSIQFAPPHLLITSALDSASPQVDSRSSRAASLSLRVDSLSSLTDSLSLRANSLSPRTDSLSSRTDSANPNIFRQAMPEKQQMQRAWQNPSRFFVKRCIKSSKISQNSISLTRFPVIFCQAKHNALTEYRFFIHLPTTSYISREMRRRIEANEEVKDKMLWKRPIIFACPQATRLCSVTSKITTEGSTVLPVHYTKPDRQDSWTQLCRHTHTGWHRPLIPAGSCTSSYSHIQCISITDITGLDDLPKDSDSGSKWKDTITR